MRCKLAVFVLGLSLVLSGSASAGDVMKEALAGIPQDAIGFICVPSLKQLDTDYAQAIEDLQLGMFVPPPMNSIVEILKQQLPMLEGIDGEGSLSVVFMPAATLMELQNSQVLLIPTKDPKAMAEAMGGQVGEGGIWNINMMGQPAFAVLGEKRLVVAAGAETAKAVKESKAGIKDKLKSSDLEALAGLDVAVWLDGEKLLTLARPMIDGLLGPVMAMQGAAGGLDAKAAEMNKKRMEMFMDGVLSVSFGLALDKAGLGLRGAWTSKPGSELTKQTKVRPTTDSLLQGLSGSKYMLAFGQTADPDTSRASVDQLDPFFEIGEDVEGIDPAKLTKLKGLVKELAPMTTAMRGSVVSLAPGSDGLVGATVVFETTDSKRHFELFGKLFDLGKEMASDAAKIEGADEEEIKMFVDAATYKTEAEDIEGVKVHQLSFDLSKIEDLEDEDWLEDLANIIGKDGLMVRMAPIDAKTVVIGFGGGKDHMASAIKHAGTKKAALDEDAGIKKVAAVLPKERAAIFCLAIDQILIGIDNIMKALEEEEGLPVKMPIIDAPIAMQVTGGDGWGRGDLFLPTELLVAGKNAGMMMMGSMMAPPETPPAQPEQP